MLDDECEGSYPPRGFECNICLDLARDPVVTFCGHLYCWPCIYKWIHLHSIPSENLAQRHPQCPVCKSDVSQRTMVPLYGRGQVTKTSEDEVPERPPSLRRGGLIATTTTDSHPFQQPQTHQSNSNSIGGTTTNVLHPMIGETAYAAHVSGNSSSPMLYPYPNSYAGSNTSRMRRHQLHADDKSLSRIHCFLLCCVVICLILL